MRTTDILIITFVLIWIVILLIFGVLAFFHQKKVNRIKLEKQYYLVDSVVLRPVILDFKLPEGEICYLHLESIEAKFVTSKKPLVDQVDKFYEKNAWKLIKNNKQIIDMYITNKHIVIMSKEKSYKLNLEENILVKPGVGISNDNFVHKIIIQLENKLYVIIKSKNKKIYQTYNFITKSKRGNHDTTNN